MLRWRYLKTAFSWWFGLIWAGVGSVFAIIALSLMIAAQRFESHGVTVAANIVERGHSSSTNNGSRYWLKYVYHDAAGVEHVSSADVGWAYWRNFNDGDSVPIQYLADHPSINRLADEQAGSQWILKLTFGAFGLGFGGIGWFLVIRAFIRSGQRARLMHMGVGALGTVTGIEVHANLRINGRNPRAL